MANNPGYLQSAGEWVGWDFATKWNVVDIELNVTFLIWYKNMSVCVCMYVVFSIVLIYNVEKKQIMLRMSSYPPLHGIKHKYVSERKGC